VWEDHLLPLLTCKDAARLARTCKELSVVVREHVKDLGTVKLDKLHAVLTTFPSARSVGLSEAGLEGWEKEQHLALVARLRGAGLGGGIKTVKTIPGDRLVNNFVYEALRGGILPSLKGVGAWLGVPFQVASVKEGFMRGMHELRVMLTRFRSYDFAPQLAALGLARHLPALTKLEVTVSKDDPASEDPVQWPPFIAPSLKALRLLIERGPTGRSLLPALPGVLGASGARLERLEVSLLSDAYTRDDPLSHLAKAVRCCSPTLKDLRLAAGRFLVPQGEDFTRECERFGEDWAGLLAGVSTCCELEVLVLPNFYFVPLFPPGTTFGRLTHLEISDYGRSRSAGASLIGLWELMALGGCPQWSASR
jgi:hypothetical protein